ncbi:formamidopyrimidine-DNA glycosylase, partial [Candidatus Peregrinibacteria bacterium]|nr:formamidopyrimidine-DNA glycosylase [Candidatus Peregrinibacteria bacterium]
NIYADEICFDAGLRPEMRTEKLKRADIVRLHAAILSCLQQGIDNLGTSISDFVNSKGQSGRNQDYLMVYGRKGEECRICRSEILKIRVAGRGTYYCQICQT